jgi:hypothetical protein
VVLGLEVVPGVVPGTVAEIEREPRVGVEVEIEIEEWTSGL